MNTSPSWLSSLAAPTPSHVLSLLPKAPRFLPKFMHALQSLGAAEKEMTERTRARFEGLLHHHSQNGRI